VSTQVSDDESKAIGGNWTVFAVAT